MSNDTASGFIDKTGTLKIRVDYLKAEPFSDGLAAIGTPDEGYVYIDTEGKQVIPERFALASRFFHGLAHVRIKGDSLQNGAGTFADIDKTGRRVFTYKR